MSSTGFARLIGANVAPLVMYARQWCEVPEDVIHEAFLKLVRQSRPPGDFPAPCGVMITSRDQNN